MTFVSVKRDLLIDQIRKLQPDVDKSIELFNLIYPKAKIITGEEDKSLKNTEIKKEYDRIINGKQISYAGLDGLSAGANVSAGYTSHVLFVDEAQEVNDAEFNTQIKPFLTSTGGPCVCIGTTLPEDTSLLYNMFKDKQITEDRRIFYTWEDVYKAKKLNDEKSAEIYKNSVTTEINKYGLRSDYIQTQYYCSFKVRGNKFVTNEDLENNKILTGVIEEDISDFEKVNTYKIAGFDPATTNDYCSVVTGIAEADGDKFNVSLKNCYTLNRDDEKLSPERMVIMVADICKKNKIDMIIMDSSANQDDRAYYLYKELKARGINTFVIPYAFGNKNKQTMMRHLEDSIYNQTITLPRREFTEFHEDYKELLDELLYLQVTVSETGTIKYKAPEGTIFFDDHVMSLAMMNFCCHYVKMRMPSKHKIDLGDGVKYYLRFHKYKMKELKRREVSRVSHYRY